jgi:hypothetical protein
VRSASWSALRASACLEVGFFVFALAIGAIFAPCRHLFHSCGGFP